MRKILALSYCLWILVSGCTKDAVQPEVTDTFYPPEIEAIMVKKCATAGCHTSASKVGASDLDLSSWHKMFEGNNLGAVTIPFSTPYSPVFTFSNSYSDLGSTAQLPKMPLYADLLSKEEASAIKTWIDDGAPDKYGMLRWPLQPDRKKFYVINQASDNVFIFDLNTQLTMAVKEVGVSPGVIPKAESPHQIRFTPDGKYYLVAFYDKDPNTINKCYIERYRATDDSFIDRVEISHNKLGLWGTFAISSDSKKAYSVDYTWSRIAVLNLDVTPMTASVTNDIGDLIAPHGITVSPDNNYIFVTGLANEIWKLAVNSLTTPTPSVAHILIGASTNTHEIAFNTNGNKYYLTCLSSGQVRVFDTLNAPLATIILSPAAKPQEMAFSKASPSHPEYLFVTVQDEIFDSRGPGYVAIIDCQTNQLVKKFFTGPQPHGIAVDDKTQLVYVTNTVGGGHHAPLNGAVNGNVVAIDINTLQLLPGFKPEVGVNPYAVAIRPY